jgi:hypothetical protein
MRRNPKPLSKWYILVKTLDLILEFHHHSKNIWELDCDDREMDKWLVKFQQWICKQIPLENLGTDEMGIIRKYRCKK